MRKSHGQGRIQTLSPTIVREWHRGICPHCGDVLVRKNLWQLDLGMRWHDWYYHKIPMVEVLEGE